MKNREAFIHAQDEHLDIMIALAFDLDDAEAVQQLSETDDPPLTTDDERRAEVLLSSAFSKAEQQQRQTRTIGFRAVLRKVLPAALRYCGMPAAATDGLLFHRICHFPHTPL